MLQVDNIINEEKYIGNRLAGTQIQMRNAKSLDVSLIVDEFIKVERNEKKISFKKLVQNCCLETNTQLKIITKKDEIIGIWSISSENDNTTKT